MSSRAPAHARGKIVPIRKSWLRQSRPMRLLRAFLGVTFVYAGIQKFADPNYLHRGSPDFIGSQLRGFAHGTPLGGMLNALGRAPVLVGIAVAATETAIGAATLLGVAPMTAAVLGAVINGTLFLTATWHVHPYFLGSDSIYMVAWIAYAIGIVDLRKQAAAEKEKTVKTKQRAPAGPVMQRREVLRGGLVAAITFVLGGLSSLAQGSPISLARRSPAAGSGNAPVSDGNTAAAAPTEAAAGAPSGKTVGNIRKMNVGGAAAFTDPNTGDPAALVRLSQTKVVAFSRVCTHAGCSVDYDPSQRILFCPCHGAEFDPARDGRAIRGPAYDPLPSISVQVDQQNGDIVAT